MVTEIIAYRGKDHDGEFGDIEVFEGTKEQLDLLRTLLIEYWRDIDGADIEILYRGSDRKAAEGTIAGLPRVSEEIGLY